MVAVPFDLLVQALRGDAVDNREAGIEHHLLPRIRKIRRSTTSTGINCCCGFEAAGIGWQRPPALRLRTAKPDFVVGNDHETTQPAGQVFLPEYGLDSLDQRAAAGRV